jgi:hypothetical protein
VVTILVLSGIAGCDTQASRERTRIAEETARRQAETEPPTQEALSQIRAATEAFMKERHGDEQVQSCAFTSLTPNLFLVGVTVRQGGGEATVRQLSAERLRDMEEGWFSGELKENGDLLWVIDDLNEVNMRVLATRHGLGGEVDWIRGQDPGYTTRHSWGHRTWLDDYLLWHYLYHRPAPVLYTPGGGYQAQPMGYRFQDPGGARIQPEDARPYEAAAARTGGRSAVFLGGSAWRPPPISQAGASHGSTFVARGSGIARSGAHAAAARGGFGAAGRAAAGHFGG